MSNERVQRLDKLFAEEIPTLVKRWYSEYAGQYPKRYKPLSTIEKDNRTISIFEFIEEYIKENYIVPFELNKYFDFHNPEVFYYRTEDFGFTFNANSKDGVPKKILGYYHDYEKDFNISSNIFSQWHFLGISGLSNIVKKKIKEDIELECELIKYKLRSYLKRFFIHGGYEWKLIVADQICFYGVDKYPNTLDHQFSFLEYCTDKFDKEGHLGLLDDIEYIEHPRYKLEKKFFNELKKKKVTDYTNTDVLKYYLILSDRLNGKLIYANCKELGKIPVIELNKNSETPIRYYFDFRLDITDVLKDDALVHEYLETYNEPENEIRKMFGLPKIGEGWISETNLYYEIKSHFSNEIVIHHGKPKWLGKQHLDIYLPKYNIGIEYQGDQHYFPVEFFGGEESYSKNKIRDARKKELCEQNNCHLIYVNPDYVLKEIIEQLNDIIKPYYSYL